jgi:hypothetical protein
MNPDNRADPAIYSKLRGHAFELRLSGLESRAVHAVLMDWHVSSGTATVLASADGTASIYLSSGGGHLGGGQGHPEIREAALHAVRLATSLLPHFQPTETFDLPGREDVAFYLITGEGVHSAVIREEKLKNGTAALTALGAAMQMIITRYRLTTAQQRSKIGNNRPANPADSGGFLSRLKSRLLHRSRDES